MNAQAGFTLIEMLVTVTLLALLAVLLFGGLRFGVRAWEGAEAHGTGTEEIRAVQDLLRREIEQAYPGYDARDPQHPVVDFAGAGDAMTFLAPAPQVAATAGRSRITLAAAPDGQDTQLVIAAHPELGGAAWSAPLLRHLAAARFAYFANGRWREDWHAAALPALVRLRVAFRPGDVRVWPELIVAPRIAADAGCRYDPATKRCQDRP